MERNGTSMNKIKLILGSQSKNRREILDMVGLSYEVITSKEEENSSKSDPKEYVAELSQIKAKSVQEQISEKAIIITADEVIVCNGKIHEKPKSKEEATAFMREISGNVTYATTGVTIKDLYQDKEVTFTEQTEIRFRELTDAEITWYIDNEESLLNRCGYVIKGKAAIFIENVNGDYNNALGLPISRIFEELKKLGYEPTDFELKK